MAIKMLCITISYNDIISIMKYEGSFSIYIRNNENCILYLDFGRITRAKFYILE